MGIIVHKRKLDFVLVVAHGMDTTAGPDTTTNVTPFRVGTSKERI